MNKNQKPYMFIDWGADPAAGGIGASVSDAIILPELDEFHRCAKRVEIWGDTSSGANTNDGFIIHINECSRRVQRNLESADTVTYKMHGNGSPGIRVGLDFNQPYVLEAKDWGGAIMSIRVSDYQGVAAGGTCTIKVS